MDWIKVTDRLPKDGELVIATVRSKKDLSFKDIMKDVSYIKECGEWGWDDGADCIILLDENMEVTHWMPYPAPAED